MRGERALSQTKSAMNWQNAHEFFLDMAKDPRRLKVFLAEAGQWRDHAARRNLLRILELLLLRMDDGQQCKKASKALILELLCNWLLDIDIGKEVESVLLSSAFAWKVEEFWQGLEDREDFPLAFRLCLAHIRQRGEK